MVSPRRRPRQRLAQNSLGVLYQNGQGVPQDYAEALTWYRLAADQGNARAQFNLGNMYRDGRGVTQDYAEAIKWFRLAADLGQVNAITSLADCYENGNGVQVDLEKAVSLYTEAAKRGFQIAHQSLGSLYERGLGLPRNDVYAAAHYLLASRKMEGSEKYDKAMAALGRMMAVLSIEQRKRAQALADSWPAVRPASTEVAVGSGSRRDP